MMNLSALTREQLEAMVIAQNQPKALSLKVSEKGAVSIYGMGRFPITLYKEQALRILDNQQQLRDFITANDAMLSQSKADPRFAKQ